MGKKIKGRDIGIESLASDTKESVQFYKDLGYTDDQSIYLATHVFGEYYGSEKLKAKVYKYEYKNRKKIEDKEVYNFRGFSAGMGAPRGIGFFGSIKAKAMPAESVSNRSVANIDEIDYDAPDDGSFGDIDNLFSDSPAEEVFTESTEIPPAVDEIISRPLAPEGKCTMDGLFMAQESFDDFADRMAKAEDSIKSHKVKIDTHAVDNRYSEIIEKGFRSPEVSPTSTFASTVNTASMGAIREKLKTHDKITPSMVRIEEMLNYYNYNIKAPKSKIFNINAEVYNKPLSNNKYLFIGVKGKVVESFRSNIVFLVDVSGSMGIRQKMEQVQKSIMTVIKQLKENDIVSLITYSDTDEIIFSGLKLNDKSIDEIIDDVTAIPITGCTNGSAGIDMAYKQIKKYYIPEGNNRVLLFTDGDFNFGNCDIDTLKDQISEKKSTGAFLTCLGYGCANYSDEIMETLAKNGNGFYFRITSTDDIKDTLQKNFNSNSIAIAKDVKIQVEFNPSVVAEYRLIGYENRALNHEDFRNDKVYAEPVGSGHSVIAVYELKLKDKDSKPELRYQKQVEANTDEICNIAIRYKEPNKDTSNEISKVVKNEIKAELSDNMNIAYAVIVLGETLRESEYVQDGEMTNAIDALSNVKVEDDKLNELKELIGLA